MTHRNVRALAALIAIVAAGGCNEQQLAPGISRDLTPPVVTISRTAGDSVDVTQGLSFSVLAQDNLALRAVSIALTGGFTRNIDTTFAGTVTATATIPVSQRFAQNSVVGGWVFIQASATDGAGNVSNVAVDSIYLKNENALLVTLNRPSLGATSAPDKSLPVNVRATQRDGVAIVGYYTTGVFVLRDSLRVVGNLPADTVFDGSFRVPANTQLGIATIRGFAIDALGRRVESSPRDITILSTLTDTIAPTVTFRVDDRIEVDDSITVRGTDPSGITELGWVATRLSDQSQVGGASQTFGGDSTDVEFTWVMNIDPAATGTSIQITAYAIDAAGNDSRNAPAPSSPAGAAGAAQAALQAAATDTVIVVFGTTRALPAGGRVADAIYNSRLNEVYLTNVELDRLEIFRLVDTSFVVGGIPVGAQPVGLALWPRDTLGAFGDTVIVANSGGTNISVVDVAARFERRRHALPNFLIQSVQTELDGATGLLKIKVVEFDFSDRPQYVAATCRPTAATTVCAADSIYAVYSTTGTLAQAGTPVNYIKRGTVRWENLTSVQLGGQPHSHFWWEQAASAPSPDTDTLQIIINRPPSLVETIDLSAACGVTVNMEELGFADTTFVRNSGNFTHALIGEGGSGVDPVNNGFARAIGYQAYAPIQVTPCDTIIVQGVAFAGTERRDLGISPSIRVRDFIVNTATKVRSIGLNFNGLTNMIRADSIYIFDEGLRLQGIISVGGANPGMDVNFDHNFDAGNSGTTITNPPSDPARNNRLMFAATANPTIEVFDTFFYGRVRTIPIKDPVIGPLRVAKNAAGQQILIGVTKNGVVLVALPAITNNPFPAPWEGGQ